VSARWLFGLFLQRDNGLGGPALSRQRTSKGFNSGGIPGYYLCHERLSRASSSCETVTEWFPTSGRPTRLRTRSRRLLYAGATGRGRGRPGPVRFERPYALPNWRSCSRFNHCLCKIQFSRSRWRIWEMDGGFLTPCWQLLSSARFRASHFLLTRFSKPHGNGSALEHSSRNWFHNGCL